MTYSDTKDDAQTKLYALQSPEIKEALERLRLRYPAAPSVEEVQLSLDKALGERSLTEELYRMRGCDG